MRRPLPLLLRLLFAGLFPWSPASAQPPPGYVPPSAPSPTAPPYARGAGPGGGTQAYNQENCGTPDEPKSCPPMPRSCWASSGPASAPSQCARSRTNAAKVSIIVQ